MIKRGASQNASSVITKQSSGDNVGKKKKEDNSEPKSVFGGGAKKNQERGIAAEIAREKRLAKKNEKQTLKRLNSSSLCNLGIHGIQGNIASGVTTKKGWTKNFFNVVGHSQQEEEGEAAVNYVMNSHLKTLLTDELQRRVKDHTDKLRHTMSENAMSLQEAIRAIDILFDAVNFHILNSSSFNTFIMAGKGQPGGGGAQPGGAGGAHGGGSSGGGKKQETDKNHPYAESALSAQHNFTFYSNMGKMDRRDLHGYVVKYFSRELRPHKTANFKDFLNMVYWIEKKHRVPLTRDNSELPQ